MPVVLVLEDESDIVLSLRLVLERAGYEVVSRPDGRTGLRALHERRPDLVVLDIGLPSMDGWTVLERIRDLDDLPVLVLTAHGQESDKVRGLRAGADDYVTKPFHGNELVARVDALLRRARRSRASTPDSDRCDVHDDGTVRIDRRARTVHVGGGPDLREVVLTAMEFRLLNTFVAHAGAVLAPQQLLAMVWDDPVGIGPDRVKFAVMRLRRKLGWDTEPSPIQTVRGAGYRYRPTSR